MYLVDDMLYRKLSHSETGLSVNQNTSSVPDIFVEKKNHLTGKHFENRAPLQPERVTSQDRDNPAGKLIQTEKAFPEGDLNEKSIPSDSNHSKMEQHIVNMDTTETSDPACKCADKGDPVRAVFPKIHPPDDQPQKKIKKTLAVKRSHPSSVNDEDVKKMKVSSDSVSSSNVQKEDEYDPDSDPELQELRDRFNKIKYDINYPPPRNRNLGKARPARKRKPESKISYLCSICNTYFERRQQLFRHLMNEHPTFAQTPKVEPEKYKRGMKRKSSFENISNKKVKTDGRQKRKSNFPDNKTEIKKNKTEYKCRFCGSFYRTEKGLNRHEKNVHDMRSEGNKTKRKRNDDNFSGSYIKRKKMQPYKSISYQNYF